MPVQGRRVTRALRALYAPAAHRAHRAGPVAPPHPGDGILRTRAVRAAVAQERREKKITRRQAMLQAQKYAQEIAANYSPAFVRFLEHILTRLWNRLYDGVEFTHVETLERAAETHEIVYVPCHRSHMDYLLLSYAIFRHGYAIPHIAAGINLNLPIVGRFLRKGGAFFIRRSLRGNALYTVVFMNYLAAIMARGHSLEYFIEGGRSRTGRLLQPKTGMLAMTVRSFLREPARPVVFVPVYFGYERIFEGSTYIGELVRRAEGEGKHLRPVARAAAPEGALRPGARQLGRADRARRAARRFRSRTGARAHVDDDARLPWVNAAVDELALRIMRNINAAAAVTPINLLALMLLATPRQAMLEADLLRQLDLYQALLGGLPVQRARDRHDALERADDRLRRGDAGRHARDARARGPRAHERCGGGARHLFPQQRAASVRDALAGRLRVHGNAPMRTEDLQRLARPHLSVHRRGAVPALARGGGAPAWSTGVLAALAAHGLLEPNEDARRSGAGRRRLRRRRCSCRCWRRPPSRPSSATTWRSRCCCRPAAARSRSRRSRSAASSWRSA